MRVIFVIAVAAALALGIFSVIVQRGANIVKLNKNMVFVALLSGAFQLGAAAAGYGIGLWILSGEIEAERSAFWSHVLAGILLAVVGARMILTATQKKTLLEHRMEHIDTKGDVFLTLKLCVNALLSGVACGIMRVGFGSLIGAVFAACVICAVIGYISGRAYGGEISSRFAGAIGGSLLCAMGVLIQVV